MGILRIIIATIFSLSCALAGAQIQVGGNVYGGGNQGNTGGKTTVNIYGGDLHEVYGGARMADVGGSAFVHVDGEHASGYIVADYVYGGNDIAGTIGTSETVPTELTELVTDEMSDEQKEQYNAIDNTWNVFVRISTKMNGDVEDADAQKIFIGQLFGGGNGAYTYTAGTTSGKYNVTIDGTTYEDVVKPEVGKTYLELLGGSINYAYGGGNNATITGSTVVCFDNPSEVVTSIKDTRITTEGEGELLTNDRFRNRMGINMAYSYPSSDAFQVGRFYGGNNLAEMAIRPTWNLKSGKIRNLYSGGNRGTMTSPEGLMVLIPDFSTIVIDNLYGGCRMADVRPTVNGEYRPVSNLPGYVFPAELSARVLVRGGDVNNVYGGNDITGRVYGGSAIGIRTSVRGDVYGGGNGSYAYTDNSKLADDETYGDLYYTVPAGKTSVEALNDFRPNAEQVSIHLIGTSAEKPTIIGGSVYCGGNSASLKTNKSKPMVELKMGSYVIAENVYLGNNGANIIKYNAENKDETGADAPGTPEGVLYTMQRTDIDKLEGTRFSSIDLTVPANFEAYMQGVAMPLVPNLVHDEEERGDGATYIPYTSYVGSFFCGGNVGSMTASGTIDLDDVNSIRIYNKFVGGCNDAYVPAHAGFNAECDGGFTVASNPKLRVNLNGLKLYPMHLLRDGDGKPTGEAPFLAWNTNEREGDLKRFIGGNVYGGCYNSGHINGNVEINVNAATVNKQYLFEDAKFKVFGEDETVQIDNAGVSFDAQREEIFLTSLGIFGAGYGENSEVWGSTTVNLNDGYSFLVFGGGEKGVVGKKEAGVYTYNANYSTTVNLKGTVAGTAAGGDGIPAAEYIYAGGFEGTVAGNTYMNLGNGRINASFGGACNADILGHAETYVGKGGYPYVLEDVYGANDLGGRIRSAVDFKNKVREGAQTMMHNNGAPATASAYVEYLQGHVRNIFGGCYGKYDYSAITTPSPIAPYQDTIHVDVDGVERDILAPYIPNAFVHVRPEQNVNNSVVGIFGAGEGDTNYEEDEKTPKGANPIGDMLQDRSYVLVDIPEGYSNLKTTDIYGAGSFNGVGMWIPKATADDPANADQATAIIDLICGDVGEVHGGGYEEGLTRRTMVNVPEGSIVKVDKLFGGSEGVDIHRVCDVYESHVNYDSETATVGTLYGGNNHVRQTLYAHVDVSKPAWSNRAKGWKATVYGAGYGIDTWANYTEVNLNNGATVYEVYGGGEMGRVANVATAKQVAIDSGSEWPQLPNGYGDGENHAKGLADDNMAVARLDGLKHNTNVLIHRGATVENYAYGGGRGYDDENTGDGDVNGTTYIALMGGTVKKDIYAAGTIGAVLDEYGNLKDYKNDDFVADATAYIAGGSVRNVYGGGWKGSVGKHKKLVAEKWVDADISDIHNGTTVIDIPGTTHVYVGIRGDQSDANKLAAVRAVLGNTATTNDYGFYAGVPTVQRNAYGGGEGGAVFGTTNLTLNNGYVGYVYSSTEPTGEDIPAYESAYGGYYQEKLHDETWTDHVGENRLYDSGCLFGGGYVDNSSVDITDVKIYGGVIRNSVFGGGEIAAIGRGKIEATGQDNSVRTLEGIYKAGKANVELYEGQVHRNVFGGGRGYNNLGEGGTLYSDGYVFGQTEVHVHGGTVGTVKELARENGNVFGGGDIGYVYSAYEEDGKLYVGIKDGERYKTQYEGYYYAYKKGTEAYEPGDLPDASDENWVKDNNEYVLTEDCKVLIEPHAKALSAVTVNGHSYAAGEYVTTEDLNTMGNKNSDSRWNSLDATGIVIYNAVFAGGNTSSGSSTVYANATTVFGNATASVHDVYHRDLITLGTGRTGGLYGDGNLTFVDGYRGLNITNYGTDYYTIAPEIDYTTYEALPAREAAYYQLKYKCIKECTDKDNTTYHTESGNSKASTLTIDDLLTLFENVKQGDDDILLQDQETGEWYPNPEYWEENGVCSIYAGRLMNTIQRADFCGVFGSRMVMQGAQDRVPEIVDHTNYTINRVREVSLNQKRSTAGDNDPSTEAYAHGNYFGIYSIVNYLGALTSDVFFMPDKDIRVTDNVTNPDYRTASNAYDGVASKAYGTATYYDWKAGFINDRKRNNGSSKNKVALASGVYLELTTEQSTGTEINQKDWGYITGVVELDLINVQPGVGGGFVYAKNVHKKGSYTQHRHNTLTALNANAITRRDFTYNGADVEWETSGNFIHSTQTIIDDCYSVSGKYKGSDAAPAHYWFIKGSVYVYDQYISAYTGAPDAYSEAVNIPLTITAASHGTMKLLNVMPNKYAYYSAPNTPMEKDQKIVINNVEYKLNDPINYWDWFLLTNAERNLFVNETYVTIADCKYSSDAADVIPAGTVMLPSEYTTAKVNHPTVYHIEKQENVDFDFVFRSSNNMSHNTGYILTYKVNNPKTWNTWYTKVDSSDPVNDKKQEDGTGYEDGPTYRLTSGDAGIFGQRDYKVSNLISQTVYDTYQAMATSHSSALPAGQATFEPAYLVTQEYTNGNVHLNVGSAVSATEAATMTGYVAPAYISTSTIQLSKTEYIYVGSRMTEAEKTAYTTAYPSLASVINAEVVPAYYCTADGKYGGNYYEADKNYRGLAVWSSMSESDRANFAFNYDAFDLLIDPNFSKGQGEKYQYDAALSTKAAAEANPAGYSLERPVDYTATYNGNETSTHNGITLENNKEYSRTEFESLPNEKRHYAPIDVSEAGNVYVVKTGFQVGNTPYAVGNVITASTYNSLGTTDQANIATLTFAEADKDKTFYFCRESYVVGENTEGVEVTNAPVTGSETGTYSDGGTVPVGFVITDGTYNDLPNWQTNFIIHGIAPTETSTLYVSRNSDIFDLSKEKIITVIYEYNYEESDATGAHVTPVSERHVVNIHVQFKSGIPTVEDIRAPQIVLPGTFVGIREPYVTPGAYEVTGGGWKLFETKSDAESHTNGIEYTPTSDPLYRYQDDYYLAYYAKTYLGETYSNAVQVSVANYHDLKKVMEDKEHHYYIDHKDAHKEGKRIPKIYINDYTADGKNGLDLLSDLYKLTLGDETAVSTYGALDSPSNISGAGNLDIIFRTNIIHADSWTPIGSGDDPCFSGNIHGDGHYVSALDNSLFGKLCGKVYNLGVMGTFTGGGIADVADNSGSAENCWIKTSGTPAANTKAVIGSYSNDAQVKNCYYPGNETFTTGAAMTASKTAFYYGEVAYNLNRFYLQKRYNLNRGEQSAITDTTYVTSRYGNPDFIYADGTIPEEVNTDREKKDPETGNLVKDPTTGEQVYIPLYPYDYLFFGQALNYGHVEGLTHQDVPSPIVKESDVVETDETGNRVYRAPAYFRNSTMSNVYFNPYAVFAKTDAAGTTDIHKGMTAVDFTGYNDAFDGSNGAAKAYGNGAVDGKFFPPLLDVDEVTNLSNYGLTKNLLVYTEEPETGESASVAGKTGRAVQLSLSEPEYPVIEARYGTVAIQDEAFVNGHWVYRDAGATTYGAANDHLLIDKNDFWAPIGYEFDGSKHMWYQRTPDTYAGLNTGWESIVLPFTVLTVSTHQKGEITHFFTNGDTDGKIGHEYWLREYTAIANGEKANTMEATFSSLKKNQSDASINKHYTNNFLWEELHQFLDEGQNTYYKDIDKTYSGYPLQKQATPYIIGFPGKTFYEFDLSGEWTAPKRPAGFERQVVTFASSPGITIRKSDDDMTGVKQSDYTFTPSYLNQEIAAGTENYVMAADGSKYVKVPAEGEATTVLPFRAYFAKSGSSNTLSIVFSDAEGKPDVTPDDQKGADDNEPSNVTEGEGGMTFTPGLGTIVTRSTLKEARTVLVYGVNGALVKAFDIKPNSTVTIHVPSGLVYAIRTVSGDYSSKLLVR